MTSTEGDEHWRRPAVVLAGTTIVATIAVLATAWLRPVSTEKPPAPPIETIEAGLVESPAAATPAVTPPRPTAEPAPTPAVLPPPKRTPPKPRQAMHEVPQSAPSAPSVAPPAAPIPPPPPPEAEQGAGFAGGTNAARAIFQPAPDIPPELRRHALSTVAVVRFTVASDGTASAELVEATPEPRLNQVLLDTFRRWRFFPAVAQGKPVASTLILKVPIRID